MAKQLPALDERLIKFIEEQKIFFVGTAACDGRVNVSPKGMDTFRILGPNHVIWLNLTGSGNETAAHVLQNSRMTIMFCAFDGKPLILRLYGQAKVIHQRDKEFSDHIQHFDVQAGARQIFSLKLDLVQTSCGFAVPLMDFQSERTILKDWAEQKGEDGIKEYWEVKNQESIDGFKTMILP